LQRIKHTSDLLSVFSSAGMLKKSGISLWLFDKDKSHCVVVSVGLILGNTNEDGGGGIRICCVSDCKYADGWRRLDKWGAMNR
jgi:hypothetical protein